MGRRNFIVGLACTTAAWPLIARAQQAERMRRIGVIMGFAETDLGAKLRSRRCGRNCRSWVGTKGAVSAWMFAFPARMPAGYAPPFTELMGLTPEVSVSNTNLVTEGCSGGSPHYTDCFRKRLADPVGSGFVSNEARPNGNLTGFANWEMSMSGKWLELLKEVAPRSNASGCTVNPETAASIGFFKFTEASGPCAQGQASGARCA